MKSKFLMVIILSLLMTFSVPHTLSLTAGQNPNDDFNDNSLDSNKWLLAYPSATSSVIETNQELQMELTSASSGSSFEAAVVSNWTIGGDFDIQVDYRLIVWPKDNGIRIGLQAGPPTARGAPDVVERVSAEPEWGVGEVYLTHFSDEVQGVTPTNHTSGKLRLTRIGSSTTGYYWNQGEWIALHSSSTSTGNGSVQLSIRGHYSTPGVLVAFDNFMVNYGQVSEMSMEEEVYTPEIDPYFTMHVLYVRAYPAPINLTVIHQMLRTMAQNLAGIGIEVHLHFMWWEQMLGCTFSGKLFSEGGYDATFFAWVPDYPINTLSDTAQWMRDIYHSSNMPGNGTGYNILMWNSTENDALLDAAVASTNTTEIESLLHHWQALFYQEQPAAIIYHRSDPELGPYSAFGQLSFNMLHPAFGTGIDTPLGQSNGSRAAEAAKYVRQAISHTIDREFVVSNARPEHQPIQQGITPITPAWPGFDSSLQPYALNLTEARRLLSLAGYGMTATGSSPISLWLTDSTGRHVGVDPKTGNVVVEIPWAFYSGPCTKPQLIYIPWPQGQYSIQVTGTETGGFTLTVTQITEQKFTGVVITNTTYEYTSSVTTAGAETTSPGPIKDLQNLKPYINALESEEFATNPDQLKGALNHKIDEAISKIQEGNFRDAINKLTNDLYPKVVGARYDYYASGGVRAWIVNPQTQEILQTFLQQTVKEIEQMQAL